MIKPDKEQYKNWNEKIKKYYDLQELKNHNITFIEFKTTCLAGIRSQLIQGYTYEEVNPIGEPIESPKKKKEKLKARISNWSDYFDLAKQIWDEQPFFFDEAGLWWSWQPKQCYWKITDEINLFNFIDDCLQQSFTVKSKFKSELMEALKRLGRKKLPDTAPPKWIQFNNKAYSLNSGNTYDVTSDYFFCNPIPWDLGTTSETPIMDSMFKQWVGEEYVQTLHEIIAYCCYTQYPIHRIFAFIGSGCNGKSTFQALLRKFIGVENTCATELDVLLDSRFESAKLYKKLCCVMGETNFGVMAKTSLLKKLSGQDLIGFEWKNKQPFEAENYAKLIINSNSMPSSGDTSEGFYRRWMIIDFPNKFKEGRDILQDIPEHEYNNLAKKVTEILPKLLAAGSFTNEGTIEERQRKYIEASNPLKLFLESHTKEEVGGYIRYSEFYTKYVQYLKKNKKRIVTKHEFGKALELEGLEVRRTAKKINDVFVNDRYVEHIIFFDNFDNFDTFSNSFTHMGNKLEKGLKKSKKSKKTPKNTEKVRLMLENQEKVSFDEILTETKILYDDLIVMLENMKRKGEIVEIKPDFYKIT